jgi:hypothetical protein
MSDSLAVMLSVIPPEQCKAKSEQGKAVLASDDNIIIGFLSVVVKRCMESGLSNAAESTANKKTTSPRCCYWPLYVFDRTNEGCEVLVSCHPKELITEGPILRMN